MARTNIPITQALANNQVAAAPTTIDAVNSHNVAAGGFTRRLLLRINNTFAGIKIVTLKAGVYPGAARQGIGDLALSIPASSVAYVPIESARYEQTDGSINIDIAASMTGTIEALQLAKGSS